MTRRVLAVLIACVLAAGVLSLVLRDGGTEPRPEQARLEVEGRASVIGADGTVRPVVDASEVVDFGEQVSMEAGTAVLELAGGATYELRHRDGVGSVVEVGAPPRVTAGDVLVVDGFPAGVVVDTATLTAQGALRVDADESVASAYAARTGVTGVGEVAELRGLRRLVLVVGAQPEPVVYDGSDEWDRRFLGEAIAFGERLEALARGYTSDLAPGAGRSVAFFQAVLPALDDAREFSADLLDPARPPGETLVGAAITVQGRDGTFRERWQEVFDFRAAGAAWGLVALDQGVSSAPLLDTIELAIAAGDAPAAPATTGTQPRPTTSTTAGDPTTTTSTTTTTTTTPAPEPAPEPGDGGLLDPVLDPTSEVLGDVLDLLGLAGG